MSLKIIKNDITKISCDAIVNAANKSLLGGGGVDGAIHKAAGIGLFFDCLKLRGCKVGDAKITPAHKLPCKYIIHTVGPKWKNGTHGEAELLADCYLKSLTLAKEHECESVAFPLISTGVYKFPKAEALKIAVDTISKFLEDNEMEVTIVVYEKSDFQIDAELDERLSKFIDEKYEHSLFPIDFEGAGLRGSIHGIKPIARFALEDDRFDDFNLESEDDVPKRALRHERPSIKKSHGHRSKPSKFVRHRRKLRRKSDSKWQINRGSNNVTIDSSDAMSYSEEINLPDTFKRFPENISDDARFVASRGSRKGLADCELYIKTYDLEEKLLEQDESFSQALIRLIDERGMTDPECYKKANVDRKLFSKIRCDDNYHPRKTTAIAFAIALELNYDETQDFIGKAGYTLTHSSKLDLVVEFFIQEKKYNIIEINNALFARDLSLLG